MQDQYTTKPSSTVLNEDISSNVSDLKWKIYCDMDGVLVNFNKRFSELSSLSPKEYNEVKGVDKFWETIDSRGVGFWVGMDWMDDGKELFNLLKENFNVEIQEVEIVKENVTFKVPGKLN